MAINNNGIFNAALAGASGGVQNERQISDSAPSAYSDIQTQIIAFATAVDTAIAPNAALTDASFELMQSICHGVSAGRFLVGQTPANLATLANAIAGFWTELKGGLKPSSSYRNLGTVLYVDASVSVAGDGNIENPFKTIQQAVTAAVALITAGAVFITIQVAPGNYGNAAVDCTGFIGSIVGMMTTTQGVTGVGNLNTDGFLILENLALSGTLNSVGATQLFLINTTVSGVINADTFNAFSINPIVLLGAVTLTGSATLYNYSFGGLFTAAGFFADKCGFSDIISHGNLEIHDGTIENITIDTGNTAALFDCTFDIPGPTLTGADATSLFNLDAVTNQSFLIQGGSIVTAHRSVNGRLASDTLTFAVAGIAAGGTAYFDAAIPAASVIHDLAQDDPIEVNPKTDLAAAGANAGFLTSARVSAANTVRICLRGNIADGNYDFVVTRL